MASFYTVLRVVVCSVLFSYTMRSKAGYCVQSQLSDLCLLSLPLAMGIAMWFFFLLGHFWKAFGSGQSDVRSGNSTTYCLLYGERKHFIYAYPSE